ncbi:hypothetical protein EI94DRAFT_1707787 [Lactarius quietus]|nr:hypothetical protein EI94DRAFT_1707787 [Lactarius quietus]
MKGGLGGWGMGVWWACPQGARGQRSRGDGMAGGTSAPRRLWSLPNNLSTNIEQPVKQNEQLFDNNNNAKRRKSSQSEEFLARDVERRTVLYERANPSLRDSYIIRNNLTVSVARMWAWQGTGYSDRWVVRNSGCIPKGFHGVVGALEGAGHPPIVTTQVFARLIPQQGEITIM